MDAALEPRGRRRLMDARGHNAAPFLLGWRANGDGLDTALVANRLSARGVAVRRLASDGGGEAGDYIVDLDAAARTALAHLGVRLAAWDAPIPPDAPALATPATLLFAGTASKFPYYAYYSLALLRLGIPYLPVDGKDLAGDALDQANLVILPGGFSTWGIDKAEDAPGADRRMRDFLAEGGTAIGSCGGAFYLSAGRPDWTGTARAKPLYTHEYLQSGVGVVAVDLPPGPLSAGLPPTMEIPYYHGPIYDRIDEGLVVAGRFHALTLPGGLAIDNPLTHEKFQRDMAGKPAVLLAAGNRGRAVLFSPHPEMGDLIRKYIALDGYVRHYLPIRGYGTMRDTLRFYRTSDAPSFRLVQNAVDHLMATARHARLADAAAGRSDHAASLERACRAELAALPGFGADEEGRLLRALVDDIAARIEPATARVAAAEAALPGGAMRAALDHLALTATAHWREATRRSVSQRLMELELVAAVMECWARIVEVDRVLAQAPAKAVA
ncbi:MAG: hypothetical protein IT562_11420 [Alphaproteobacteria bacterium]|nr:hypothetical protein [Alphaproteobacteria bacterium]